MIMTQTDICKLKRDELLALPQKPFTEIHQYESILVVPTRKKHDSRWRLMALVGCKEVDGKHSIPVHIIGYCDDINLLFDKIVPKWHQALRCDMTLSNCLKFWSNYFDFEVGCATSSTDIHLIPDKHCK